MRRWWWAPSHSRPCTCRCTAGTPCRLISPSGASTIDIVATPQAPAPPAPKDGQIVGNVYRITATAGGDTVDVVGTGHAEPTLQMRAPSGKLAPVFEHRTSSGWEQVHTARI